MLPEVMTGTLNAARNARPSWRSCTVGWSMGGMDWPESQPEPFMIFTQSIRPLSANIFMTARDSCSS